MELRQHNQKLELVIGKGSKIVLDGGVTIGETSITAPGEYEITGIGVEGHADESGVVYHVFVEDLAIAHLGGATKQPSEKIMEAIEDADVLVIPADDMSLPAAEAQKIVSTLEPKVVVLHPAKAEVVSKYFPKAETVDSLKCSARDLPEEGSRIIVLT